MHIRRTTSAALFGMPVAFRTSVKGWKDDPANQTAAYKYKNVQAELDLKGACRRLYLAY
jgi:hypothetical protein